MRESRRGSASCLAERLCPPDPARGSPANAGAPESAQVGAGEFLLARRLCFELMRVFVGGIAAQRKTGVGVNERHRGRHFAYGKKHGERHSAQTEMNSRRAVFPSAKPNREVEGPEEAYPVWALTLKGFLPPVPSKVAETQALLVSPSPIGEKTSVTLPRLLPRPSRVAEKAVTNMAMNRMNMEAYCPMP